VKRLFPDGVAERNQLSIRLNPSLHSTGPGTSLAFSAVLAHKTAGIFRRDFGVSLAS